MATEVLLAGTCWNKHSISELISFRENLGKNIAKISYLLRNEKKIREANS